MDEKLKKRMDEFDYSKGEARKCLQTEDILTLEEFLSCLEFTFYELFPNKYLIMEEEHYDQFPNNKEAILKLYEPYSRW